MQQLQPSSLNASSVVATQPRVNPPADLPSPEGSLKPSQTCWVSRFSVGGRQAQLCFPGSLGALRSPRPHEYFAPLALSDWASKTWWVLSVAMFTLVVTAGWTSISFVPSGNILNKGGDADQSWGEETCLQLSQTQPHWAAAGFRET